MREDAWRSRPFAKDLRRRMTNAEVILWSRLRYWPGIRFRRQHPIGSYVADFACIAAKLVIEIDGNTHGSDTEQKHDAVRDGYMRKLGWRMLRLTNRDVYDRLDDILDVIAAQVAPPSTASRSPSPVNGGGST